jgi:hypothetical protein
MLKTIARIVLALQGAAALFIAANVWLDPVRLGAQLGVAPIGDLGLSTIRSDIGGFFAGAGVFMLAAAITAERRWLYAPLVFTSLALASRTYAMLLLGMKPEFVQPMTVEAVTIVLLVVNYVFLGRKS